MSDTYQSLVAFVVELQVSRCVCAQAATKDPVWRYSESLGRHLP